MKIGIISPYFDSFSGGERYLLTLAAHWSKSHSVQVFWDEPNILDISQKRFNLDLSGIKIGPQLSHLPLLSRIWQTKQYDLIVWLTDGSLPTTIARHNILHIQVPFASFAEPSWKIKQFSTVVCNSLFTQEHMDKRMLSKSTVIYPPVSMGDYLPGKKERLIVSVGRFSSQYMAKKHEVLIEAFTQMVKSGSGKGWRLAIAGGLLSTDQKYFDNLHKLAKQAAGIELYPNCSFETIQKLYAKATLYWHAAGFAETDPVKMEHFGITTVEAMSAGCVPVVYAAGGQPEIITDGQNGYLWQNIDELLEKTSLVIADNRLGIIQEKVKMRAGDFSVARFCQAFDEILKTL